jgi:purine nucleosidase
MREDTKALLYVVCGARFTNIASAYLMEPKITNHITLIWIGGPEYKGLSLPLQSECCSLSIVTT